jgi:hypothetical protein
VAWKELLGETGIGDRLHVPIQEYPDSEAVALIEAAARRTGATVASTLDDFGAFLVPGLVQMFGNLINPQWKTLDLILNTEKSIHTVLRAVSPAAKPPSLECTRTADEEVVVVYRSPRKLCALAKGIARGVANHYGEKIAIRERLCMHKGSPYCEIFIKRLS